MLTEKKIACLAVDDEPPALTVIEKYISSVPVLELKASVNNAVDALSILQHNKIDLIFLDIQMPQLLGTDFMRSLINPPKVIFTTAFRKYAVEGFELDAVDYLLKPISFERFLKAVNKVSNSIVIDQKDETSIVNNEGFLYFRVDRKMIKVNYGEIVYVESLKESISSLEEVLPANLFVRIHRSYIIALHKISAFTNHDVEIGGMEIPIGRLYAHQLTRMARD